MIAHQKTKGKRELLNLKSSINYGDASAPSRRSRAGKSRQSCSRVLCPLGLLDQNPIWLKIML
jgi:hypothetical protein